MLASENMEDVFDYRKLSGRKIYATAAPLMANVSSILHPGKYTMSLIEDL
jgi:hypothetical protein